MDKNKKYPPSKPASDVNIPFKNSVVWFITPIFASLIIYTHVSTPSIQEMNKSIPSIQAPPNLLSFICLCVAILVCSSKSIQKAILKNNRKFKEIKGYFVLAICISCTSLSNVLIKILFDETYKEFSILSGSVFLLGILISMIVACLFGLNTRKL